MLPCTRSAVRQNLLAHIVFPHRLSANAECARAVKCNQGKLPERWENRAKMHTLCGLVGQWTPCVVVWEIILVLLLESDDCAVARVNVCSDFGGQVSHNKYTLL